MNDTNQATAADSLKIAVDRVRAALASIELDQSSGDFAGMEAARARLHSVARLLIAAADSLGPAPVPPRPPETLPQAWLDVRRQFKLDIIQDAVAAHYGIERQDLKGPRRLVHVMLARQVAIYLTFRLVWIGTAELGRLFERDFTIAGHAIRKIGERRDSDPAFDAEIKALIDAIFAEATLPEYRRSTSPT